ncbi:hypothetical protein [Novosphingobium kaempferiae]|uniref:hypothetical protein n=1 Tax=Novosphingobium kaempferiae TaxID=2896849 RepID=UPI001E44F7D7|nr:hypothetical protein [Novosphingobium kaempferiae]
MFEAIHSEHADLKEMMVKFIGVEKARQMRFPPSLSCPRAYMDTIEFGPTELRSIEWVEFVADVSRILAGLGQYPFSFENGRTRVTGYTDPLPANVR